MTDLLKAELQRELEERFPWLLEPDEPADGGDTVEAVMELYIDTGGAVAGMTIHDFSDKELADMVRNSLYVRGSRFGDDEHGSRFLLVLAVPYGNADHVDNLPRAMEGFRELLTDEDWTAREFQVYDHRDRSYSAVAMEELTYDDDAV